MEIFRGYTTSDVLFDIPYVEPNKLILYPLKVKDYGIVEDKLKYLLFSKKYLKLDNNINLFEFILGNNIASYMNEFEKKNKPKTQDEVTLMVLGELCELFSVICREDIVYDEDKLLTLQEIVFRNKNNTININRKNFEKIRPIIIKQNAIREPFVFENKLEEQIAEKYMKAQQKKGGNNITDFGEIANFVSCYTGKSYESLYNQNVLQLQTDYYRCVSLDTHKTNVIFATMSDKAKLDGLTEEVVSKLYGNPYDKMWKDFESFGFV